MAKETVEQRPEDFVVDLCRDSEDTQVVFAHVPLGRSLKETLTTVEADITAVVQRYPNRLSFGPNGQLLIPEIAYRIAHEFKELEEHSFLKVLIGGQRMDIARQDLMFRLDRSGTELISEAMMMRISKGIGTSSMIGDKPFLIYLKKRGAALPYFVMWVDNSELLMKWE